MSKSFDHLTARESVWVHRIRQRIALERIILTIGNPREQQRAKQFLEAMEQVNPELFEGIEEETPSLLEDFDEQAPELFDTSEYCPATGRKTAFKLPKDIAWEGRVVYRAAREFRELFHPCDKLFNNAMKGLQYLANLHPELFERARERAQGQRERILIGQLDCPCGCITAADRPPADRFETTPHGRLARVSQRISTAQQALGKKRVETQPDWPFFLERIREIAPEMLQE